MRLNVKAMALTGAIVWGGCTLIVGLVNTAKPPYGLEFLTMLASVYPGYHAEQGFTSTLIGTGYAILDGAVGGALIAWLYNLLGGASKP